MLAEKIQQADVDAYIFSDEKRKMKVSFTISFHFILCLLYYDFYFLQI
jgi:hypothetical protein